MSAQLADTLEHCLPAILHEWERRASTGELRSVCQTDRAGDLADVLRAICAALAPDPTEGAIDTFIEIAAAHGARRRLQGVHEACLFEEYDFLGTAVPHALRESRIAPLTPQDLLTLEGALTTAILAGLRGYHRGEFERRSGRRARPVCDARVPRRLARSPLRDAGRSTDHPVHNPRSAASLLHSPSDSLGG
jgi:hypothetical protein